MYIDPNSGGMIFGWLLGAFGLVSGLLLVFSGRIRAIHFAAAPQVPRGKDGQTPKS